MDELPKPLLWIETQSQLRRQASWAKELENCKAKKAYPLEVHAKAHALQLMNNPRKDLRASCPIYTYNCPICGHWHITKKKPRP